MNKKLLTLCVMAGVTAGADAQENYEIGKPSNSAYAYLNDYGNLKDYINYEKYPNFKLGVGTDAADYNRKGTVYKMTNANFTETVAGNAMKMASCVSDNGSMNFSTVKSYVNNATAAGLSVYGHVLAWHSQQAVNWLSSLLKDKPATDTTPRTVTEDRRCIVVDATAKSSDAWDNQFWIITGNFAAGSTYEFSADVRADVSAKASTQIHTTPTNYVHYIAIGDVNFTTDWKTVKSSGTLAMAGSSIAFNLNEYAGANKYYLDNISFKVNGKEMVVNGSLDGSSVESFKQKINRGDVEDVKISDNISYVYVPSSVALTAQEAHDTLVWAMDKWISGMMTACNGKVKAWDVVNEALSGGGDDGQGNYVLQHRDGYVEGQQTWDVGGNGFYWQDYMGDLEYVRQAVRLARKYGPEDVKLFINDYNLESDWDGNQKLKSLINWIKKWEADGTTHIDGIGTQMHISYYEDANTQKSKKSAITNMFKLMAATGRLVRVSEMDMGYVNASGNTVTTGNMTETQHKNMADFYKWIIQQYLALIPADQQWGICQWCANDAPSYSGWRADNPVGWWDLNNYRKHAYAGVCEGLGGVNYATGVEQVETSSSIVPQGVYDLQGRKVNNPSRGLYIIGGKKMFVK